MIAENGRCDDSRHSIIGHGCLNILFGKSKEVENELAGLGGWRGTFG